MQLIWSRCINIHGVPGRNIPCDLHLEHLNHICKETIANLGSRKTDEGLLRSSKCVGELNEVTSSLDQTLHVYT